MNKLWFLFLFISCFGFTQNLEETIYVAAETFIANKNNVALKILNTQETSFKNQVKTKDEQLALVFLQSNKGYYLDQNNNLKAAILTFENAIKRFNDNNLSTFSNFDIIENCLKPLGNLYTKTGDYTNALNTINNYIFLAKKSNNSNHIISGAINLSKLYYSIGEHKLVLKITDNALKIKNFPEVKKAKLLDIKTASLVALKQYNQALNLNNSVTTTSIKEKNNYLIALKKGNYKQAFIDFKKYKLHKLKDSQSKRDLSNIYIQEAELYYMLKHPDSAISSLKQALKILLPNFKKNGLPNKSQLYAENKFIDIFDLYAEIETKEDLALKSFDLSFYVSNLLKDNWTSQKTKILNISNNRNRSEKCINILFNIYNKTKNKTALFKAFQYSENNKASVLKEMAIKKLRLQHFPKDSLLIKEFNLLKTQDQLTNLLIEEELGNNRDSIINNLSLKLNKTSIKIKALQPLISNTHTNKEASFSLSNLQNKLLKDNATLVEYFYGKQNLYQFIVTDKDIVLNKTAINENFNKKITKFNSLFNEASIINNNISNYTTQAYNIYNLLNFKALNSYKNILIIPDSYLNFTPFESLLTHKTKTTSFSKMPFVVKTQKIAYNTNVFFYLNRSEKVKNNKLLGFFPVFKNTTQQLNFSINEANAIEKEMSSEIYLNEKATKENFIKKASQYSIIHLSTHANSGNFIEPATISFYNENLSINELYGLDLNPDLVVLSACETGVAKLYKSEGSMSIARGFLYAGSQNIVFSLWQINDLSTSQLMESFYRNFNKSESAFTANHLSKIEYLENESISNAKKSPYYWSAFVFYGKINEPTISSYNLIYILLGVSFLLPILIFFVKRIRGHK